MLLPRQNFSRNHILAGTARGIKIHRMRMIIFYVYFFEQWNGVTLHRTYITNHSKAKLVEPHPDLEPHSSWAHPFGPTFQPSGHRVQSSVFGPRQAKQVVGTFEQGRHWPSEA